MGLSTGKCRRALSLLGAIGPVVVRIEELLTTYFHYSAGSELADYAYERRDFTRFISGLPWYVITQCCAMGASATTGLLED